MYVFSRLDFKPQIAASEKRFSFFTIKYPLAWYAFHITCISESKFYHYFWFLIRVTVNIAQKEITHK